MASITASRKAAEPVRHVRPGRIFIMEFTPTYPDAVHYSRGVRKDRFTENASDLGMFKTLDSILGRENRDKKGELLEPCKKVIYGVVSGCGIECERASALPLPENLRDPNFPLPLGTLVKLSNAVDQRVAPDELEYNNWDLHEYKLPGEYHNNKRWGLLTEEIQELVKRAQLEGERYE